jgi:hypothetical protein
MPSAANASRYIAKGVEPSGSIEVAVGAVGSFGEDFGVLASGDLYGDIKAGPLQAKLPRRRQHIVSWDVRREGVATAVPFTAMVNEPAGFPV